MASRHTNAQAKTPSGQVTLSEVTTDSPLLPVEQIARLKDIAPERVDWVFNQTETESNFRRIENRRINTMTFIERMAGLLFALIVAAGGLGVATYLAVHNHDTVAGIIGGTTVVGLVAAFITGRNGKAK